MIEIFYKTIPFFALIGLGYSAALTRFFSAEATAYLTKFVFYFALSAMLFRFSSDLSLGELYDPQFILAYLSASIITKRAKNLYEQFFDKDFLDFIENQAN